jgi:hypothetical protein
MQFEINADMALSTPPVRRAAYSDRTAWLMAVMSLLAYVPFEAPPTQADLREIAGALAGESDVEAILVALNHLVSPGRGKSGRAVLETQLGRIGFELVKSFSISDGLTSDTQAFIAKVCVEERGGEPAAPMLVLAFRGTQPTRIADIRSDIDAVMITVPGDDVVPALVHRGFFTAFQSVREPIDAVLRRYPEMPVYVTGHSLGGALAVVATRFIANQSEGACYTFGAPRCCNEVFADQIFTPIYRVVNASDGVAAIPFDASVMRVLTWAVRRIPGGKVIVPHLEKMKDYRHLGDARHLAHAAVTLDADGRPQFPGMRVRPNPTLLERWKHLRQSWGAPLSDHDIQLYVEKLAWHARQRLARRQTLNTNTGSGTDS